MYGALVLFTRMQPFVLFQKVFGRKAFIANITFMNTIFVVGDHLFTVIISVRCAFNVFLFAIAESINIGPTVIIIVITLIVMNVWLIA